MKTGAESRNKTVAAGVLVAGAVLSCGYFLYSQFFESDAPRPVPVTTTTETEPAAKATNTSTTRELVNSTGETTGTGAASTGNRGLGAVPGVAAQRVANTSSSLDPTLDQSAMLRTESLVYTGTGRNIFSLIYTPPVVIPTVVPKVRSKPGPYVPPAPPPPPIPCPPNCPPMPLKFFGTATRNGVRQAFLLSGEDVYLASQGDIVARRYKVVSISANSVLMEDLTNHFQQTLPMATQ